MNNKNKFWLFIAIAVAAASSGCGLTGSEDLTPKAPTVQQEVKGGMRKTYYVVDETGTIFGVHCTAPARNCFPDVIIRPITWTRAVADLDNVISEGPAAVGEYFRTDRWHETMPYLLDDVHAEDLAKLQSGEYTLYRQNSNNGAVYYFAGRGTVNLEDPEMAFPLFKGEE
ncbi:hypothetical protein [Hymenobacter koreensis]|uniref:Lipoprotein n=1 Tax=Hymenobacter koreensis TaxID=1084523 RepID=A0ABP8IY95_9BACT